jgi:Fe-S oxidoreductase
VIAGQCDFVHGSPESLLVVEFYGASAREVASKAHAFADGVVRGGRARAAPVLTEAADQARVWAVRRAGLGLMATTKGKRKPISFIEDAAVPVEHLAAYIGGLIDLCGRKGVHVSMYAHASVGVLHVKPVLDLKDPGDVRLMTEISSEALSLVMRYGGSWSGEHGDGLARSAHLERFFGPRVYELFREVKTLFDPEHLMNPGKIVDAPPATENFRYAPPYPAEVRVPTVFHYRAQGSFADAVELCNGTGACRKVHEGTMCPSYMATRDETHSTRGRANALRLAMTGQLGGEGLHDERLADVLDLCLSCKACKAECPSRVDLARLKSEVMQALYDRHGASLRDRAMGRSSDVARHLAGPLAPMVNALQGWGPVRAAVARVGRIDRRRRLPRYASRRFSAQAPRQRAPSAPDARRVALFADCFLEYYEPEIGHGALSVLRALGFTVEIAATGCCQRPRISKGFVRDARVRGEATALGLDRYLREGVPVVVCEPSCASALVDDLPDLLADEALGKRLTGGVVPIEAFVANHAKEIADAGLLPRAGSIRVHGHCHQKALFGTTALKAVLSALPGASVDEIDAGCCGMAGGFGYEREHYDLSMAIGEDRLFPALRATDPDALIVACGFSCRHQIHDGVGRRAVHWVEAVAGPRGV